MTLRRRLVVAVSTLAVVLVVAGVAVVLLQRSFQVNRLDAELTALARTPRAVLLATQRTALAQDLPGLSDIYLGRMGADGRLVTVLAPTSDPALVPDLRPGESIPTPQARRTASGEARTVRVLTAPLPNGRARAVLAVPTTSADATTRRLAATLTATGAVVALLVGLLLWWVDRLGLRPIAAMTRAADAIAAGDTSRRVPVGPAGTEAGRLGEALNAMIDTTSATQRPDAALRRRRLARAPHPADDPPGLRGPARVPPARPARRAGPGRGRRQPAPDR